MTFQPDDHVRVRLDFTGLVRYVHQDDSDTYDIETSGELDQQWLTVPGASLSRVQPPAATAPVGQVRRGPDGDYAIRRPVVVGDDLHWEGGNSFYLNSEVEDWPIVFNPGS